ncbi:MAG: hypothetical protein FJZ01_21750 [Candidatus Sericytochromatia bacterium]|nr:hypothetical protein [Candidatus Tanganyikabacteria bacterium]
MRAKKSRQEMIALGFGPEAMGAMRREAWRRYVESLWTFLPMALLASVGMAGLSVLGLVAIAVVESFFLERPVLGTYFAPVAGATALVAVGVTIAPVIGGFGAILEAILEEELQRQEMAAYLRERGKD